MGEGHDAPLSPDVKGVLVNLTECVGCRLCEYACKEVNGIDPGSLASYDNMSVFRELRRPGPAAFTVVNAWPRPAEAAAVPGAASAASGPGSAVYAKVNCLHCNRPACVSACIVGAMRKQPDGAVTYDTWKCIGCRYCMVACPFQIPAYEYNDALAPRVRKCELCHQRTVRGELPGCVKACPRQALTYGKRSELVALAHRKITERPGAYVNHVYGEHEVGGTSWLYLCGVPYEQVGMAALGPAAPPALTEAIQHEVFSPRLGVPPLLLYGALGALMWFTGRREAVRPPGGHEAEEVSEHSHSRAEPPVKPDESGSATADHRSPDDGAAGVSEPEGGSVATLHAPAARPAPVPHHGASDAEAPAPVHAKLLTPGVVLLAVLSLLGFAAMAYRFLWGLGAATNLDQQHPWGIWIGVDVASGVVTAAGGFTSAFLIYILHRDKYRVLARPALLTAALGYTFVCIGLQADLGRYYNVWHPMIMWNGNSVLFEVGMCVMCYLSVLYLEFAPILLTRVMDQKARWPRLSRLATTLHDKIERIMFLFIIAGCVLSCLHQSSLGNLLVITPYKLHPLWWTPVSPLLFLLSAFMIGFPMVIFESILASWSFKRKPEIHVLSDLARFVPFIAGVYLAVKIGDMIVRGTYTYLLTGQLEGSMWLIEVGIGVVLPATLLCFPRIRRSPRWLFLAALAIVLGVILNRVNVFVIGYHPPFATHRYVPSLCEIGVTVGLVALLMLLYRVIVTYFPVISQPKARTA